MKQLACEQEMYPLKTETSPGDLFIASSRMCMEHLLNSFAAGTWSDIPVSHIIGHNTMPACVVFKVTPSSCPPRLQHLPMRAGHFHNLRIDNHWDYSAFTLSYRNLAFVFNVFLNKESALF